jgi:hypothetical protein
MIICVQKMYNGIEYKLGKSITKMLVSQNEQAAPPKL